MAVNRRLVAGLVLAMGALAVAACGGGPDAARSADAAASGSATSATPGGYPARVLMLVTHSSPGGGSDVFLREMAPHLSRILGLNVVVDNVAGGSGARAMSVIANAETNGGTLYATTPTFVYTSLLSRPDTSYRDLEPIVNIFYDPEVLYTATGSPFETVGDVIEHARTGRGRWGAANPASLERMVMERLKQRTGVSPAVATFEGGGDMLINVLNQTLDMGVGELQEIRAQLDAGRVRLLGIVGDARVAQFPSVPTLQEQGIDLSVRKFRGLAGPRGTPASAIAALEAAVPQLLEDPRYKEVYTANGLLPGFIPHDEYVVFMNEFGEETQAFLKESGVIQ